MTAFPEAPFGATDHLDLDATPLAVIRHEGITISDLREVFDRGYAALGAVFAEGALTPAGPALAIYRGNPMEVFDLELGFPVAEAPAAPLERDGITITASALPEGPATATTVFGPYDGLGEGWMGLVDRATAEGGQPSGTWIEVYVTDPSDAPAELRTDLILPLA